MTPVLHAVTVEDAVVVGVQGPGVPSLVYSLLPQPGYTSLTAIITTVSSMPAPLTTGPGKRALPKTPPFFTAWTGSCGEGGPVLSRSFEGYSRARKEDEERERRMFG